MEAPGYFGKNQKTVATVAFFLYQMLIVPWGLVCLYAMITLNWQLLTPIMVICVLQYPVKKSQRFCDFVNKYIQPVKYFKSFTRIKEQPVPKDQKVMFAYHAHNIFAYSNEFFIIAFLMNIITPDPEAPWFIGLGSRFGYNAPILGLILRLLGTSTVNPLNLRDLMKKGEKIGLIPGGYEEAALTNNYEYILFLKKRKGFIKYALRYGYTIRPVINFGQYTAFSTIDAFRSLRLLLNRFKIPTAFFYNTKYGFFVNPNTEIVSITGKGLRNEEHPEGYEPSKEDVEVYHQKYIEEVKKLYEKHKHLNNNMPLVIM